MTDGIKHDPYCTHCPLGTARERHNIELPPERREYSVGGAGPEVLSRVRLIVISDFAGAYETKYGIPQFDVRTIRPEYKKDRKTGNEWLGPLNAGAMMRWALEEMFGLDSYKDVWITNAVKCNPGKQKVIDNKHTKPCTFRWLSQEIQTLDSYCNSTPILVAGGVAFSAMRFLYPRSNLTNLNASRRRGDIRLDNHPVVFTDNSAKAARAQPRIESSGAVDIQGGRYVIQKNEWLCPPLPGSPFYSFAKDLEFLTPYLT